MATRLAVRNKKQAITRERELFNEISMLKTFRVQQRPAYLVHFVARTSYADARLVIDTHTHTQTDYSNPRTHARRAIIML